MLLQHSADACIKSRGFASVAGLSSHTSRALQGAFMRPFGAYMAMFEYYISLQQQPSNLNWYTGYSHLSAVKLNRMES
jgi:hypothetical protein